MRLYALLIVLCSLLFTCAQRENGNRNNPYDANGTNFTADQAPTHLHVTTKEITWLTYNYYDSTGSFELSFYGYDPNEQKDTLTYTLLGSTSLASSRLDTLYHGRDTTCILKNIRSGNTLTYRLIATDISDSTIDTLGTLIIPSCAPVYTGSTNFTAYNSNSTITLSWQSNSDVKSYEVYRSDSLHGPYKRILVKSNQSAHSTYFSVIDSIADYRMHYYLLKLVSKCSGIWSPDTLSGRRYYSGLYAPTSVSASDGNSGYISLTWSDANSGTTSTFHIYRSLRCSGPYQEIAIVNSSSRSLYSYYTNSYSDTVPDAATYYYTIAAFDVNGKGSSPSTCESGYSTTLSAPYNFTVSQGAYANAINLSWSTVTGATQYQVYKATSCSGPYQKISLIATTTYYGSMTAYDSVFNDSTYYYQVAGVTSRGVEGELTTRCDFGYRASLTAPTYISASQGTYANSIYLYWGSSTGASKYLIYRDTVATGAYSYLGTTTSTSYYDSIKSSRMYYYKIAAANSADTSLLSSYSYGYKARLSSPSFLSISEGTYTDKIVLSWYAQTGVTGFIIYRDSIYNGTFPRLASLSSSASTYSDFVSSTKTFYYKIAAYSSSDTSLPSDASYGYVSRLSTPSIAASKGSLLGKITVFWQLVSNAAGYYVYRDTSSFGPFALYDSSTTEYYVDSVKSSITYYYKVAAFSKTHRISELSSMDYGYQTRLTAPYLITASDGVSDTYIAINFASVIGASGYAIFRDTLSTLSTNLRVATTSATVFSYNDPISSPRTYYYAAAALDANGNVGTLSYTVSGRISSPPSPSGLTCSNALYPNKIIVSWNAISTATAYVIYKDSSNYGAFRPIDTITASSFTDNNILSDNFFYYKVAQLNKTALGVQSSAFPGRTMYAPINVRVTGDSGAITLGYEQATYASGYYIYRSSSSTDANPTKIATITSNAITAYTDASQSDFTPYFYSISGYNANGESSRSKPVSATRKLGAPKNLVITSQSNAISLTWNASKGAQNYVVFRYPIGSVNSQFAYATIADTTMLIAANSDSIYAYYVRATSNAVTSNSSNTVNGQRLTAPTIPVSVFTSGNAAEIGLYWTPGSGNQPATSFTIYRSAQGPTLGLTKIGTTTQSAYHDSSAEALVTYYYAVSATNSIGESAKSTSVRGAITAPIAPDSIALSTGYVSTIKISWRKQVGAKWYKIYRTFSYGGTATLLDSTQSTVYLDSNNVKSFTYYQISATNGLESPRSGLYDGNLITPPTSLTVNNTALYCTVSWSAVSSAKTYRLYRSTSVTGTFTCIDTIVGTYSVSSDDTLKSSTRYYYKVSAVGIDESSLSLASNAGYLTAPTTPSYIYASDGGSHDTVQITFTPSIGAISYEIWRSESSEFTKPVLAGSPTNPLFYDIPPSDTIYYYRVKATGYAGQSVLSTIDAGNREPQDVPSAPLSLTASTFDQLVIKLDWVAPQVSPVNQYKIYRATTQAGVYTIVDSTTYPNYSDPVPLSYPNSYWYQISAVNKNGEGIKSEAVEGYRN